MLRPKGKKETTPDKIENSTNLQEELWQVILDKLNITGKLISGRTCQFFNRLVSNTYATEITKHKKEKAKFYLDQIISAGQVGVINYQKANVAGDEGKRRVGFYRVILGVNIAIDILKEGFTFSPLIQLSAIYSLLYIEGGTNLKKCIMNSLPDKLKIFQKDFQEVLKVIISCAEDISVDKIVGLAKSIHDLQSLPDISSHIKIKYSNTDSGMYKELSDERNLLEKMKQEIEKLFAVEKNQLKLG